MNVTIDLDTREHIDLTNPPKLDNNTDIVLSQGRERDEFKRTVEDVKLRISDQVNELTNKFRAYPITSVLDVKVTDNARTLFQGRIERPISYNVKEDFLDMQCWSKNKDFWDKARITYLVQIYDNETITSDIYGLWITVQKVIEANCNSFLEGGIITGYNIDSLYATRRIKLNVNRNVPASSVYNLGAYRTLKTETTVFDLLTAMSIYYNAEFFVDPETDRLTMLKRNTIQNDKEYNLDELLLNSEEIVYEDSDEKKYDYIHTVLIIDKPASIISFQYDQSPINTNYDPSEINLYRYTNVYPGNIESEPSNIGGFAYEYSPSVGVKKWKYVCGLPFPSSPDVTHQRLYVKDNYSRSRGDIWYLVYEFDVTKYYDEENIKTLQNAILFIDRISTVDDTKPGTNTTWLNTNPITLTMKSPPNGNIWWRYDEATATWSFIVSRSNFDKPNGKTFDVIPNLSFVDGDGNIRNYLTDIFTFFGREIDLNTFSQQWQDLFITRGKVSCTVKGLPYRVGDTFVTSRHPKIPAGKYVVKDAKNHLMREKTKLELIKV